MNKAQMQLAKEVKQRVLDEPNAVVMEFFFIKNFKSSPNYTQEYSKIKCDTVGCIAGHTCLQAGEEPEAVAYRAQELLGLSDKEAALLFYFPFPEATDYDNTANRKVYAKERKALEASSGPGSVSYVLAVAAAIDKCIKRNYKGKGK